MRKMGSVTYSWMSQAALLPFETPWERHWWLRLPFGESPAPEEFQKRIDIALEGLPDDIPVVFGAGENDEKHSMIMTETCENCSTDVGRGASKEVTV